VRAFWAVAVEEPARAAVAASIAELGGALDGVRWVRPETVHLTVHYFGQLGDEQLDAATDAVRDAAAAARPFVLRLGRLGSFPSRGSPRVLWLGAVDGEPDLADLAAGCLAGLAAAGFPVEERPFAAHCTIGRLQHPLGSPGRRLLEGWKAPEIPGFLAERLTLFESRPGPGGAVYLPRVTLPLGG
jgi:2'-5' RNA ligase